MSADNPYESPSELSVDAARAKSLVLIPAVFLLIVASLSILMDLPTGFIVVLDFGRFAEFEGGIAAMQPDAIAMLILFVAACAMYFLSHVLVFYGAIQMLRFRSLAIAKSAAIISVIPICSPLFVLGIPFGIWALIVLSKPEIRAAFGDNAAQP